LSRIGYFVAYRGSYEDPERKGGISGPYPSLRAARKWVSLLKDVRSWKLQDEPKQPLYIVRAIPRDRRRQSPLPTQTGEE
jgi:hypothetical protein